MYRYSAASYRLSWQPLKNKIAASGTSGGINRAFEPATDAKALAVGQDRSFFARGFARPEHAPALIISHSGASVMLLS